MARKRYFQMPDIDQPDPEPGFQHSSDEFIVPTADEDGETVRIWTTVPKSLHGWLGEIVHSDKFPFRYDSDLVRYGIYLACVQLSRIERAVPNLQGKIDGMRRVVNTRMAAASVDEHVSHFAEELEKLRKKKAWGEILYLFKAEKRSAEDFTCQEPYWGRRWREGLEERCADVALLAASQMDLMTKDRPSISLKPSDARNGDR